MNYMRQKLSALSSSSTQSANTAGNAFDDLDPMQLHPSKMFIISVDTLRGEEVDQTMSSEWSNRPPLFPQFGDKANDTGRRKKMCRGGVPHALRSAVWITSVVRKSRPYQTLAESDEFGTLMKVEILDHGWSIVLRSLFPDKSDEDTAIIPDFGLEQKEAEAKLIENHFFLGEKSAISGKGVLGIAELTKILYASREMLGIEYCPLLMDLAAIFLTVMPTSFAYSTIREMSNTSDYYFPMSMTEHLAWCKTFGDLMRKIYPKTYRAMKRCGALSPDALDPIFRHFFITILERKDVLRIVDLYTMEGYKVIFRLGTVILCLCHAYMNAKDFMSVSSFWNGVRRVVHSEIFNMDVLIKQAYGFNGKKYVSRRSFPRRRFITKLIGYNEKWAENYCSNYQFALSIRPLGFVQGQIPLALAKQAPQRLALAEFMPFAYKATKLELIYSSNVHGRSLELFYRHCARSKHTVTLIEVLDTGATIGMFATETWHNSRNVYGDGECVLFRLQPDPVSFSWNHESIIQSVDDNETVSSDAEIRTEALLSEFQISTEKFVSMGANAEGGSGLRLNEDLTRGSSDKARGFNNEPLVGKDQTVFDVGVVEVYQLVREIDNRPIDVEEKDIWKGMFD